MKQKQYCNKFNKDLKNNCKKIKVFAANFIIIVISIYLFLAALDLHCCCGLSLVVVSGTTRSRGFSCCGTWAPSSWT